MIFDDDAHKERAIESGYQPMFGKRDTLDACVTYASQIGGPQTVAAAIVMLNTYISLHTREEEDDTEE